MAITSLWQMAAVGRCASARSRSPARWPPSSDMASRKISDRVGAEAEPGQRGPVPVLPVADPGVAPGRDDQRDASMAEAGEVRRDLGRGGRPVDPDGGDVGPRDLAVEEDHRDARAPRHLRQLVGRALRGAEDQAVRAALEQVPDVPELALGVAPAAREDQAVPRRRQDVLGAARHVGKEGARHVAHDEPDGLRPAADQAPGDVTRLEGRAWRSPAPPACASAARCGSRR